MSACGSAGGRAARARALPLHLSTLENGSSFWTFEPAASFRTVAVGPGCVPLMHNSVLISNSNYLTPGECDQLINAAETWLQEGQDDSCLRGEDEDEPLRRVRVSRMDASARALVERMLLKVFEIIEQELPDAKKALFGDAALRDTPMRFAAAEPAVSVYTAGGSLYPHEDLEALTVLIPLSPLDAYTGGGTSFWTDGCERHPKEHPGCGSPVALPNCVLKPPRGSALLYGGGILHAAAEVTSGIRHIFVCSFSPIARPCAPPSRSGTSSLAGVATPHEASWGEARRRGRGVLNERAVWTDLQGAFG